LYWYKPGGNTRAKDDLRAEAQAGQNTFIVGSGIYMEKEAAAVGAWEPQASAHFSAFNLSPPCD
jgi:hypothetical protein